MLAEALLAIFALLAGVQLVALLLFWRRSPAHSSYEPAVSVLIPAHNEERDIEATIKSLLEDDYKGAKEIIVIDDGSADGTARIVKRVAMRSSVKLLRTAHSGKAAALNAGLAAASHGIVVTIDADSSLEKGSLAKLVAPLRSCAAASGVIRARCTRNPLTWLQDIDYMLSSGWRASCSNANGNYSMPGFAAFRRSALLAVNGFSRDTLTEDLDIGLSLRKAGYRTVMTQAVMRTSVPGTLRSLFRQRMRWGRGSLQACRKHGDVLFSRSAVGSYAMPMHMFWYGFAMLYMPLLFYWFLGDYAQYFLAAGNAVSAEAALFFVKWLTVYGIADLLYGAAAGAYALTPLAAAVLVSWLISFAYFVSLAVRMKPGARTLAAYVIVFPYFWFILIVQALSMVRFAASRSHQGKWRK